MKVRIAALIAAAAIVCVSPAIGQQAGSSPRKLEFRKWDFGGSLGILGASRTAYGGTEAAGTGGYNSSDQWTWAANIDAGQYFTTHLKADVGLMWSSERSFYKSTYNGAGPYAASYGNVHPLSISGALTYQFFENVFAHPVCVGRCPGDIVRRRNADLHFVRQCAATFCTIDSYNDLTPVRGSGAIHCSGIQILL